MCWRCHDLWRSGVCKILDQQAQRAAEMVQQCVCRAGDGGETECRFLSNVFYKLRAPINMVIGISEVALGKELPPDIQANIMSIKMAGKRLSNQISNMLDYTEAVEGTITPMKEKYMITPVLNDVITMTALQSNQQHLDRV